MTDNSFNNCMFASIHLNLLDKIDLQVVVDDFASKRNTNKLFWNTVTLIVQRLIDIKPQSNWAIHAHVITSFLLANCS